MSRREADTTGVIRWRYSSAVQAARMLNWVARDQSPPGAGRTEVRSVPTAATPRPQRG